MCRWSKWYSLCWGIVINQLDSYLYSHCKDSRSGMDGCFPYTMDQHFRDLNLTLENLWEILSWRWWFSTWTIRCWMERFRAMVTVSSLRGVKELEAEVRKHIIVFFHHYCCSYYDYIYDHGIHYSCYYILLQYYLKKIHTITCCYWYYYCYCY